MRTHVTILSVLSALSAFGCASSADSTTTDEGAVRAEAANVVDVPGTVAVRFETEGQAGQAPVKVTIGAPSKLKKVFAALRTDVAAVPAPRCFGGPTTKITFYGNGQGTVLAKASVVCSRGTAQIGGKEIKFAVPPGGFDVLDEPLVPADALYNVNKAEIVKTGVAGNGVSESKIDVTSEANLTRLLEAFDVEQKIDVNAPTQRCMATHIVRFFDHNDKVAESTYLCQATLPLPIKVDARFTISDLVATGPNRAGGISVNAEEVQSVWEDETSDELP